MSTLFKKPRWATGGSADVVEPSESKKDLGWIREFAPHNFFNWLQEKTYEWIDNLADSAAGYSSLEEFIANTVDGDTGIVKSYSQSTHFFQVLEDRVATNTNAHGICSDGQYLFVLEGVSSGASSQPYVTVYARSDLATAPVANVAQSVGTFNGTNLFEKIVCNGAYVATLVTEDTGGTPLSTITVFTWAPGTTTLTEGFTITHGAQLQDIAIDGKYVYAVGAIGAGSNTVRAISLDASSGGDTLTAGDEIQTIQTATAITTAFAADNVIVASGALFLTGAARPPTTRNDQVVISGSTSNDGTYLVDINASSETTLTVMNENGSPVNFVAEAAAGTVAVNRGWNSSAHAGILYTICTNGDRVVAGGANVGGLTRRFFFQSGTLDYSQGSIAYEQGSMIALTDRFFGLQNNAGTRTIVERGLYMESTSGDVLFGDTQGTTLTTPMVADDQYVYLTDANKIRAYCRISKELIAEHSVANLKQVATDGDQIYLATGNSTAEIVRLGRPDRDRIWRRVDSSLGNGILPLRQLAIPER